MIFIYFFLLLLLLLLMNIWNLNLNVTPNVAPLVAFLCLFLLPIYFIYCSTDCSAVVPATNKKAFESNYTSPCSNLFHTGLIKLLAYGFMLTTVVDGQSVSTHNCGGFLFVLEFLLDQFECYWKVHWRILIFVASHLPLNDIWLYRCSIRKSYLCQFARRKEGER